MTPAFEVLEVARDGAVCTLTMNRPERRNALSLQLVQELIAGFELARDDDAVRVVVLRGAGAAFCSGGDLSQMGGSSSSSGASLGLKGGFVELNLAMSTLHKPIIARVQRYAYGGAIGLICGAHFAIAEEGAKLGTPEIDRGVFPMMVMATLFRTLRRRDAVNLILLGDRIDAKEAERIGLITRAVPADQLDAEVDALAQRLAAKPPAIVKLGLEAMTEQDGKRLEEALPYLQTMLGRCFGTADAREGMMAFLEKRKPVW